MNNSGRLSRAILKRVDIVLRIGTMIVIWISMSLSLTGIFILISWVRLLLMHIRVITSVTFITVFFGLGDYFPTHQSAQAAKRTSRIKSR